MPLLYFAATAEGLGIAGAAEVEHAPRRRDPRRPRQPDRRRRLRPLERRGERRRLARRLRHRLPLPRPRAGPRRARPRLPVRARQPDEPRQRLRRLREGRRGPRLRADGARPRGPRRHRRPALLRRHPRATPSRPRSPRPSSAPPSRSQATSRAPTPCSAAPASPRRRASPSGSTAPTTAAARATPPASSPSPPRPAATRSTAQALTGIVTAPGAERSTQEQLWTLLAAHALAGDAALGSLRVNDAPAPGPALRLTAARPAAPRRPTPGRSPTLAVVTAFGVPTQPEPAQGNGYRIERQLLTLDGAPADPAAIALNDRLVAVVTVTPERELQARLIVSDPLPAGLEIENPNLLRSGETGQLAWLVADDVASHTEFRADRFAAAVDWQGAEPFRLAYMVRAVSPGRFHRPAASVEDMYRPAYRARTDAGTVTVRRMTRGLAALATALAARGRRPGRARPLDRRHGPAAARARRPRTVVLDRHGALLSAYTVADGRWRLPVALDAVDRGYLAQLVAFEDRRFRSHPGVDPLALARAAAQSLAAGRVVSGGSTLTMQVARLLEEGPTGSAFRQAPPDPRRPGARAPARQGRDPRALPHPRPLRRQPRGHPRREPRLARQGAAPPDARRGGAARRPAAVARGPPARPRAGGGARRPRPRPRPRRGRRRPRRRRRPPPPGPSRFRPSAGRSPRSRRTSPTASSPPGPAPARSRPRSTPRLQSRLEALVAERAPRLGPGISAALIVADHRTGEIRARIGAADRLDPSRGGFVDMSRAVRSPGSTLKPLVYGLAFEAGIAHPETIVEDRPMRFGGYAPQNLDRTWLGPITARTALQASRNLPAVALLDAVGPAQLMARLRRAGASPQLPAGGTAGLAIALGGVGLTPRGPRPPLRRDRRRRDACSRSPRPPTPRPRSRARVLDAVPAWYVADILRGTPPPPNGVAGRIAYKTGTSYGHRDAWAIGFDGAHVIGVWFGRPDGASVPGALGLDAAAPSLFDAFARLVARARAPAAAAASRADRHRVGAAGAACARFHARGAADVGGGPEIAFPPDGARVDLGLGRGAGRPARHASRRWCAAFPLARRRRAASGRSLRAPGRMASGRRRLRRPRRDRRNRTCGAGKRIPGVSSGRSESSGCKSADRAFSRHHLLDVPPPAAGRQVDVPSTSETARAVAATMMSASARVRQSGGAKPRMSPCGMARAMTPRASSAAATAGPTLRRRVEEAAGVAVLDELDARKHAVAAHVADVGVVAEGVAHRRA